MHEQDLESNIDEPATDDLCKDNFDNVALYRTIASKLLKYLINIVIS